MFGRRCIGPSPVVSARARACEGVKREGASLRAEKRVPYRARRWSPRVAQQLGREGGTQAERVGGVRVQHARRDQFVRITYRLLARRAQSSPVNRDKLRIGNLVTRYRLAGGQLPHYLITPLQLYPLARLRIATLCTNPERALSPSPGCSGEPVRPLPADSVSLRCVSAAVSLSRES